MVVPAVVVAMMKLKYKKETNRTEAHWYATQPQKAAIKSALERIAPVQRHRNRVATGLTKVVAITLITQRPA
jgi:hypothetical protein